MPTKDEIETALRLFMVLRRPMDNAWRIQTRGSDVLETEAVCRLCESGLCTLAADWIQLNESGRNMADMAKKILESVDNERLYRKFLRSETQR